MQHVFYIERGDLSWTVKAAQSLQTFGSIVLIFERYNGDQRTKLYGTFKGYQIQKVTGAIPKEYREQTDILWGPEWHQKVERNGTVAYVQITTECVRTSEGPVSRSEPYHEATLTTVRFSNLELKRCNICGQELPKYVYFQRHYKDTKDSRQGYCKVCQKYYLRWWNRGSNPVLG